MSTPIIDLAKTNGNLVTTTAGACIFFNLTASDQYLSIVVPGRMFAKVIKIKDCFQQTGTLEDSGTVTLFLFLGIQQAHNHCLKFTFIIPYFSLISFLL